MSYQSLLGFFHGEESDNYDKKIEAARLDANEKISESLKAPEWYKISNNPDNISWVSKISWWPERWKWNEAWAPEPER